MTVTLTSTEIPQALEAIREALEIGKLLAIRHGPEHKTGASQIHKIDDGRQAQIELRSLLREARDALAKSNEALDVVGEQALRGNMVVTALGVSALISENKEAIARLNAALKEG